VAGSTAQAPAALATTDEGDGPVVCLSHGLALDATTLAPQRRALLASGHRVITVEAPGHGRSPAPAGPWSHASLADDIAVLLAQRGVARAVVGGSSQAGWVGLHLAVRHPDLVAGVVSLAASAHPQPAELIPPVRADVRRWAEGACPPGFALAQAEGNFGPGAEPVDRWAARWDGERGDRYVAGYEALFTRPDLRPLLGRVRAPVLVLQGEHDPWVPRHEVLEMVDLLPTSAYRLVPGAWHTFTETHAEAVDAAIDAFLGDLGRWWA
jgi:3-oxoadipate enol-lactonase